MVYNLLQSICKTLMYTTHRSQRDTILCRGRVYAVYTMDVMTYNLSRNVSPCSIYTVELEGH